MEGIHLAIASQNQNGPIYIWALQRKKTTLSFSSVNLVSSALESLNPIRKLRLNSRIKPWVYVRRNTMYEKSCILLAGTDVMKNSTVACGSIPIKIHYFYYPKSFISRINEAYINVFFIEMSLNEEAMFC